MLIIAYWQYGRWHSDFSIWSSEGEDPIDAVTNLLRELGRDKYPYEIQIIENQQNLMRFLIKELPNLDFGEL